MHILRNRPLRLALTALLLVCALVEGYRGLRFYEDLSASRSDLLAIKSDLDLSNLQTSPDDIAAKRQRLQEASAHLQPARRFVETDPIIFVSKPIPFVGKQLRGMKALVIAAEEATHTGLEASDVAVAFADYNRDPNLTSIQGALVFLRSQEQSMAEVDAGYQQLQARTDEVPTGLFGPLGNASRDLDSAVAKLHGLVDGYKSADQLLPELLGYNGPRSYLVLPQNDTELFPSGGLISSYGIASFDQGKLASMNLEYFGTLFDRWQKQSGGEYVAPPPQLKSYLLRSTSWGLGEAGWYPDFPMTASLATSFVQKGGAPATDGTIAIDLQFISGLLDILGPVDVPEYNVTVTPQNVDELTLEQTRDEGYVPGRPQKAFLSYLSKAVLDRLYGVPKERWVDLLSFLERMGKERHLQINFVDPDLQTLAQSYGFDGAIQTPQTGDYLMLSDTSVNSTKLNLILNDKAQLDLQLLPDGTARDFVTYSIDNPFPDWAKGRDPKLVSQLMLSGVYGCYLRVYAQPGANLLDVRLNGKSAGPEQVDSELGHQVFGRFFPILPGAQGSAQFVYETPNAAWKDKDGLYHYQLYIQKEAGTKALPIDITPALPDGAHLDAITVDGQPMKGKTISTDLSTDRRIEITYRLH